MASVNTVPVQQQLTAVLEKTARTLNLKTYTLNLNLNALKGDGFLGEFYKVSILNEETGTEISLALKKAPVDPSRRKEANIEQAYANEIRFYSVVYPVFKHFEEEQGVLKPFTSLPEYITSVGKTGEEIIVFKDITTMGFELREKNLLLDDNHARLIFETYGHFHAISFCLKEKKTQVFEELSEPFVDIFKLMGTNESFRAFLVTLAEKCFETLDPDEDAAVREKFRKYLSHCADIFLENCDYRGDYFGILHGDCWSNNMMFNYREDHSQIEAINLLDFQLVKVGTPVHDLSYFFYTGCSKDLFDKLEDYLDIYHASFSKWAKEMGCDPDKLLPREMLTQDWKEYSKVGLLMSLMLVKIKLISKEDSIHIVETSPKERKESDGGATSKKFFDLGSEKDLQLFNERARNILVHMYEIDAM